MMQQMFGVKKKMKQKVAVYTLVCYRLMTTTVSSSKNQISV